MQKPKVDPDLARGLNFTPEDLAANRQGYMSQRQRAEIIRRREKQMNQDSVAFIFLVLATVVAIAGSVFVVFIGKSLEKAPSYALGVGCVIMIGLIPTGVLGFMAFYVYQKMQRRKENWNKEKWNVAAIRGRVILDTRYGNYRTAGRTDMVVSYWLMMNDMEFQVDKQAYLRFKHLDYYTLYYTPNTRVILSAEPMEEA